MGTVSSIADATDVYGRHVEFEIVEAWKGISSSKVSILTGRGGGDCGYPFGVGGTYLVYAGGAEYLAASICSRTRDLGSAGEDLEELGPATYSPPPPFIEAMTEPETARVWLTISVAACTVLLVGVVGLWGRRRLRSRDGSLSS